MESTPPEQNTDLRTYLQTLQSRKWTIAAVTLLVVGAALIVSFRQTPVYAASARVLVRPFTLDPTQPPPEVDLVTEETLVTTPVVANLAAELLGGDIPPDELLDNVRSEVVSTSAILEITYASTDPTLATRAANAMADAYLEYRRNQFAADIDRAVDSAQRRVVQTQAKIDELEQEIARTTDAVERDSLEADRDTLSVQLGPLLDQVQALSVLRLAQEGGGGEIVEPATQPTSPASPNHILAGGLALVIGLILGTVLAFVRERLDDRVRTHEELERRVGAPVLATVPKTAKWRKDEPSSMVLLDDPKSPIAETYRTLRTNLQFISSQRELHTVVVTSATAGDGKTVTAANLAIALAQGGKKVFLVSADLRRPRLEKYFPVELHSKGLSSVLGMGTPLWEAVTDPGTENLRVVPSGPVPPNPAELLQSAGMKEVLAQLKDSSDYVIIDTPPVLAVADASILASQADGVLLVVDADSASRAATAQTKEQLSKAGAPLIGVVFNRFDLGQAGGGYYYHYYHHYSESENGSGGRLTRDGGGSSRARRESKRSVKDSPSSRIDAS